ncbi:hypothetical protein [Glutamicibacter arilaitensis]|uniref:hypothetical protein n=1 Tax=Glutamicibacter arilaitensis TaxID=256701 RepID=UPI00384BE9AB
MNAAAMERRIATYAMHNPAGIKTTRTLGPKARAAGFYAVTWTAEQIAEIIPAGGAVVIFESFGYVKGTERFGRSTFIRTEDAIEAIGDSGQTIIAYPFGEGRTARILVK